MSPTRICLIEFSMSKTGKTIQFQRWVTTSPITKNAFGNRGKSTRRTRRSWREWSYSLPKSVFHAPNPKRPLTSHGNPLRRPSVSHVCWWGNCPSWSRWDLESICDDLKHYLPSRANIVDSDIDLWTISRGVCRRMDDQMLSTVFGCSILILWVLPVPSCTLIRKNNPS